ncbi:MAG: CoA transferase [Jatrophihabitans sp.]|uniref:CoA transferase n=1 Tax=Jatrophihabitans sp. TaxID=1932789 RepID=UPI003F7E7EFB
MTSHAADGFAGAFAAAGVEGEIGVTGPRVVLPSRFDVTGLAVASVAAASRAVSGLAALRWGSEVPLVAVDSRAAAAAFVCESLFEPIGWERPPLWDPIAGNYRTADGWIRLHTNYAHHRAAVERLLGARDRTAVAAAVSGWTGVELETAVVAAGGCAAVLHPRAEWLASEPGAATAGSLPVVTEVDGPALPRALPGLPPGAPPLQGVRVLDLTRVIAGPIATRVLAASGADVLRIDPPGFAEVPLLLAETTAGKRTAALHLRRPDDRRVFEALVADADVLVGGLRPGALDRLGYGADQLRERNPALLVAALDAYGWTGPWATRRGFDSLVQMSCGLALGPDGAPDPLPAQALDHATGWLLAAAVVRALTAQQVDGRARRLRAALIGTAELLWRLPLPDVAASGLGEPPLEAVTTAWGPARRVPVPGVVAGAPPRLVTDAGPLGREAAVWRPR